MSASIETWQHLTCPHPERCHCDCPPCRRAWFLAGRPERITCVHRSAHIVLDVPGRDHRRPEVQA